MNNQNKLMNFETLSKQIFSEFVNNFNVQETILQGTQPSDKLLEFCDQSFLALKSLFPDKTNLSLNSQVSNKYQEEINFLNKNSKLIKSYSFLYPTKNIVFTSNAINSQKEYFKLIPISTILAQYEMPIITSIEDIISVGFLLQKEVYESIILVQIIKNLSR